MLADIYEKILFINEFVLDEIKSEISKQGSYSELEIYKIIYLAWLWGNEKMISDKNGQILVDVDYSIDLNGYQFLGNSFNFCKIYKKFNFQTLSVFLVD